MKHHQFNVCVHVRDLPETERAAAARRAGKHRCRAGRPSRATRPPGERRRRPGVGRQVAARAE